MKPRKLKLNRLFVLRAARSTYQNRIVLGRENIPLAICISRVLDRESSSHEKSTWRTVKLTINRKFKDQGQAQKTNEANYKGLKPITKNWISSQISSVQWPCPIFKAAQEIDPQITPWKNQCYLCRPDWFYSSSRSPKLHLSATGNLRRILGFEWLRLYLAEQSFARAMSQYIRPDFCSFDKVLCRSGCHLIWEVIILRLYIN